MQVTYYPDVFKVDSIASAMNIILTPEGSTTEERWKTETPYLIDLICKQIEIPETALLLDYGCGIGRMTKELIAKRNCRAAGVDISASMRALAPVYVQSERFFACSPETLDDLVARGLRCDYAISIWVLQHCLKPADDIARLHRALRPGGQLFVVNGFSRAIPTREKGWVNDGIDLRTLLDGQFSLVADGKLSAEHTTAIIAEHCFWASYRRA